MARRPRVELADPRTDHVQPVRVALVACLSIALGIATALAIAERSPSPMPSANRPKSESALEPVAQEPLSDGLPDASVAAAREPTPSVTSDTSSQAQEPSASAQGEPEVTSLEEEETKTAPDTAAEQAPAAEPPELATTVRPRDEPAPSPTEPAPGPTDSATGTNPPERAQVRSQAQVIPTAIAYVRCDGLERRGARYPCPRDRLFERRAREVMERLPECPDASALESGEIDLRLHLSRWGGVERISMRRASAATKRVVRACAEPALLSLTTTLRSRLAIVSLRFEVR